MKKVKPVTLGEIRKLIKQISRVTYDSEYGILFAALLSAMRGPDFDDQILKQKTTACIRRRLNWFCGTMNNELPDDWHDLAVFESKSEDAHFELHIRFAVQAMATFGLIKLQKEKI